MTLTLFFWGEGWIIGSFHPFYGQRIGCLFIIKQNSDWPQILSPYQFFIYLISMSDRKSTGETGTPQWFASLEKKTMLFSGCSFHVRMKDHV